MEIIDGIAYTGQNNKACIKVIEPSKTVKIQEGCEIIADKAFKDTNIEEFIFPSTLRRICKYAFNHSAAKVLDFSNTNLQIIDNYAFSKSLDLEKIILPNSCMTIKEGAFRVCENLYKINLENTKITEINNLLFDRCINLTDLTLPNTVTKISISPFRGSSLKNLNLSKNLKHFDISIIAETDINSIALPDDLEDIDVGFYFYDRNLFQLKEIIIGIRNKEILKEIEKIEKFGNIKIIKKDLNYLINENASFSEINKFYKNIQKEER